MPWCEWLRRSDGEFSETVTRTRHGLLGQFRLQLPRNRVATKLRHCPNSAFSAGQKQEPERHAKRVLCVGKKGAACMAGCRQDQRPTRGAGGLRRHRGNDGKKLGNFVRYDGKPRSRYTLRPLSPSIMTLIAAILPLGLSGSAHAMAYECAFGELGTSSNHYWSLNMAGSVGELLFHGTASGSPSRSELRCGEDVCVIVSRQGEQELEIFTAYIFDPTNMTTLDVLTYDSYDAPKISSWDLICD